MQGYCCMHHHTERIVHMLNCTAGPVCKNYGWKQYPFLACQSPCSFVASFPTLSAKKQQAEFYGQKFEKRPITEKNPKKALGESVFICPAAVLATGKISPSYHHLHHYDICSCVFLIYLAWQLLALGRKNLSDLCMRILSSWKFAIKAQQ